MDLSLSSITPPKRGRRWKDVGRRSPPPSTFVLRPLLASHEHSPQSRQRIVEIVDHPFFQRDDRVVGNVDVLGTDFRAALRDVAEAESELLLQQLRSRKTVQRMHLEPRDPDEKAR